MADVLLMNFMFIKLEATTDNKISNVLICNGAVLTDVCFADTVEMCVTFQRQMVKKQHITMEEAGNCYLQVCRTFGLGYTCML